MRIGIRRDLKALEREFGSLPRKHQIRVIPAAMNKAGKKAFTTARQTIASLLQIKQYEFAGGKRSKHGRYMKLHSGYKGRHEVAIQAFGRAFNLTRFGARAGGGGIVANVMGRGRTVPGAFVLPKPGVPIVKRGSRGKMRSRKPGVTSYITKHNQKLDQVWGASAADALRTEIVRSAARRRMDNEIGVEYQRAIKRELSLIARRRAAKRRG